MADLRLRFALPLFLAALAGASAFAQSQPVPLNLDATAAPRRLLHATLQFPVTPGPLSLLYPKWIPGEHGPTGPIEDLAGLRFSSGGKAIPWHRDDVNIYEFHVDVPPGVSTLDVALDFILAPDSDGFSSGASSTTQLAVLSWNQVLLYPKGTPSDQLQYQATLKLPGGWRYGTALPVASESAGEITFQPSSLTTLIDSPVQAGINFKTVDLSPDGPVRRYLHIAADSERATRISEEDVQHYRDLVRETDTLFGAHHYRDYHFLYTLSDHIAHFGLEHHESSDDRVEEDALIDEDIRRYDSGLLSHEFVHSWNGKFRRPAGLATPDYAEPMKGDLLWVYEGLTEYLGEILAPRSGLATNEDFFDSLAWEAAWLDQEAGRQWRPLEDTAVAAQVLYNARPDYADFRRGVDYYEEGTLIWLDVDTTIRTLSKGAKSLDDFCKAFAGPPSTLPEVRPYTFDDIVRTLNSVQPYDWTKFLNDRLQSTDAHAPLNGILNGGYKLTYTAERSVWQKSREITRHEISEAWSIGVTAKENGDIVDVHLGSPAFLAGVAPNARIIAVNGRQFTPEVLHHAVEDSGNSAGPLALLIRDGEYYKTYNLEYRGGEKFPHLIRDGSKPDLISDIIRAHAR